LSHDTATMGMQHAQTVLGLGLRIEVLESQIAQLLDHKEPAELKGSLSSSTLQSSVSETPALRSSNGRPGANLQQQFAETALKVFGQVSSIETRVNQLEERIGAEVRQALGALGINHTLRDESQAALTSSLDGSVKRWTQIIRSTVQNLDASTGSTGGIQESRVKRMSSAGDRLIAQPNSVTRDVSNPQARPGSQGRRANSMTKDSSRAYGTVPQVRRASLSPPRSPGSGVRGIVPVLQLTSSVRLDSPPKALPQSRMRSTSPDGLSASAPPKGGSVEVPSNRHELLQRTPSGKIFSSTMPVSPKPPTRLVSAPKATNAATERSSRNTPSSGSFYAASRPDATATAIVQRLYSQPLLPSDLERSKLSPRNTSGSQVLSSSRAAVPAAGVQKTGSLVVPIGTSKPCALNSPGAPPGRAVIAPGSPPPSCRPLEAKRVLAVSNGTRAKSPPGSPAIGWRSTVPVFRPSKHTVSEGGLNSISAL